MATAKYKTTTPQALRKALDEGLTLVEVAERLGVPLRSVQTVCTMFGWRATYTRGPKIHRAQPMRVGTRAAHNPFGL